MKLNERGGAYEAPRIEWLDVAVEAGFAASTEGAAGIDEMGEGVDGSQSDWN